MTDNFNIHDWNRNRLLETIRENSEDKATQRVNLIFNQIIKDFPNIFDSNLKKSELRFSISSALVDLSLNGLLSEGKENQYEIEYWTSTPDGYDNNYITVNASSEEEAIEIAKQKTRLGSKFSVYKSNINENKDINPIQETIKFIMEDLEGFSKYFPGGKTKGLTNDELSTILMNIVKDIQDDGKQLDESTLCKRGQDYIKSRKTAGEKSSAYLSGRAVKVCKGDIKFKGKKIDSYNG